jgi:hypothetical protein
MKINRTRQRERIVGYFREIKNPKDMDLIIALDMAKEGFEKYKSNVRNRKDGRTRCIFENGTESNMLYRSRYKAFLANVIEQVIKLIITGEIVDFKYDSKKQEIIEKK